MQRFLRFVVEESLNARDHGLKEYLIGVHVFDRAPSFDPRLDPIVRVEARRLRRKLAEYYERDGNLDPIRICFEKGTYAPQFHAVGDAVELHVEPPPDVDSHSMAVLPFRNIGPEPEHDYFSDGLTEELIHLLTRLPALRVVAWNSAAQMEDEHDFARVRRELKVAAMLRGTIRRSGDQLRITVQLIDTCDGSYLWSEIYSRRMKDVLEVESEIAQAIAAALKVRTGAVGLSREPACVERVTDPESHRLYLLGRYHSNRRTPEGLTKSVESYQAAIEIDPGNAAAHAGLALTYVLLHQHYGRSPETSLKLAGASAHEALRLDPMQTEAYTVLAYLKGNAEWQWDEAEALYRRAIECNPGFATAHHWFSVDHLLLRGRFEEADLESKLSTQLDPLSAIIREGLGLVALYQRRYEEALALYMAVRDLDPFFYRVLTSIGRAYSMLGQYHEAIDHFRKAVHHCGDVPHILTAMGQTYGLAGMHNEARRVLHRLDELSANTYVPDARRSLIHIGLGEFETALDLLESAIQQKDLKAVAAARHPAFDALRGHPRFERAIRHLHLN